MLTSTSQRQRTQSLAAQGRRATPADKEGVRLWLRCRFFCGVLFLRLCAPSDALRRFCGAAVHQIGCGASCALCGAAVCILRPAAHLCRVCAPVVHQIGQGVCVGLRWVCVGLCWRLHQIGCGVMSFSLLFAPLMPLCRFLCVCVHQKGCGLFCALSVASCGYSSAGAAAVHQIGGAADGLRAAASNLPITFCGQDYCF